MQSFRRLLRSSIQNDFLLTLRTLSDFKIAIPQECISILEIFNGTSGNAANLN